MGYCSFLSDRLALEPSDSQAELCLPHVEAPSLDREVEIRFEAGDAGALLVAPWPGVGWLLSASSEGARESA